MKIERRTKIAEAQQLREQRWYGNRRASMKGSAGGGGKGGGDVEDPNPRLGAAQGGRRAAAIPFAHLPPAPGGSSGGTEGIKEERRGSSGKGKKKKEKKEEREGINSIQLSNGWEDGERNRLRDGAPNLAPIPAASGRCRVGPVGTERRPTGPPGTGRGSVPSSAAPMPLTLMILHRSGKKKSRGEVGKKGCVEGRGGGGKELPHYSIMSH